MKSEIILIKQIYALPVYNLDNIEQIDDTKLQISISDSLFLDTLL